MPMNTAPQLSRVRAPPRTRMRTARPPGKGGRAVVVVGRRGHFWWRSYFSHFLARCSASTMRTVPERERITMDWVVMVRPR